MVSRCLSSHEFGPIVRSHLLIVVAEIIRYEDPPELDDGPAHHLPGVADDRELHLVALVGVHVGGAGGSEGADVDVHLGGGGHISWMQKNIEGRLLHP